MQGGVAARVLSPFRGLSLHFPPPAHPPCLSACPGGWGGPEHVRVSEMCVAWPGSGRGHVLAEGESQEGFLEEVAHGLVLVDGSASGLC